MVFDGSVALEQRGAAPASRACPSALTCSDRLAEGQRLGLSEDVGHQHVVMAGRAG